MALKMTSGSWNGAQGENQAQRDAERDRFFGESGAKVASSMGDVFLPPAARINRVMEVMGHTISPRIDDENLAYITTIAQSQLALSGLCVPCLASHFESRPRSLKATAPEVLRSFFSGVLPTTLDRSLF